MAKTIKIFITYSHQDKKYLAKNSLLGFLRGLEKDHVEFWTDQNIKIGELWDDVIKASIQKADIALVLVSQAFLDSEYCQNVEIKQFLAQKKYLFPVILSPCEWRRHEWLASRQFLPRDGQNIEEHFKNAGKRKALFLEIREQLRNIIESIQGEENTAEKDPMQNQQNKQEIDRLQQLWDLANKKLDGLEREQLLETRSNEKLRLDYLINEAQGERDRIDEKLKVLDVVQQTSSTEKTVKKTTQPVQPPIKYSGKTKLKFCTRLLGDWKKLADYFEVSLADQRGFANGDEPRDLWTWLEIRNRLSELPEALTDIDRPDLAELLQNPR